MQSSVELKNLLKQIDRKSYPAYKSLKGKYRFGQYILSIDHVQGDPFASPSRVHIEVASPGFPEEYFKKIYKRIALQDYIIRQMEREIAKYSFQAKGSGKSGLISISHCGQEVIERSACQIMAESGEMVVGIEVGFPANGRTVNARELEKILFEFLPGCIQKTLYYKVLNQKEVKEVIDLATDQHVIRKELKKRELVAFVANGSILPRESGISPKPMSSAVLFQAPKTMEIEIQVPNRGLLRGMGIKKGITVIIGGGYHGKSTLLKALALGVYNHKKDDGREFVLTDDSAVKIRAEDGRSIRKADISLFIRNLPNKKNTKMFETEDASGSTSQAANVVEGIEAGSKVLLIDEDTSATNFMIRDELMQRVVHPNEEPIIPFIERIKDLYEKLDISTILVAGSSGTYFHVADTIIQMEHYIPRDVTSRAKEEAKKYPMHQQEDYFFEEPDFQRIPKVNQGIKNNPRIKLKTMGKDSIIMDKKAVELHSVEQIVDAEQTRALGQMLLFVQQEMCDEKKSMQEIVEELLKKIEEQGIQSITKDSAYCSVLAMPRRQEVFACFNRYREWKIR